MTKGVISTIPFNEYLKDLAISSSAIKIMHRAGPETYYKTVVDPAARVTPATPAMLLGSLVHCATREPDELPNRYQKCGPRNTKAGKQEALYIESKGLTPINFSDWKLMEEMVQSIRSHPIAAEYLDNPLGVPEQSFWWDDELSGLCCKARTDLVVGDTIIDLKTTVAGGASPKEFAKTVANFAYNIQAAHYLRGTEAERFIFLVVEKVWPYNVGLFELDQAAIDLGNEQIDAALKLIKECHEKEEWPGHADEISTISLPRWAFYQKECSDV